MGIIITTDDNDEDTAISLTEGNLGLIKDVIKYTE